MSSPDGDADTPGGDAKGDTAERQPVSLSSSAFNQLTDANSAQVGAVRTEVDRLLFEITSSAIDLLSTDRATLFFFDAEEDSLWSKAALGTETLIAVKVGAGLAGDCARLRAPVVVADAYEDARFDPKFDKLTGYHTKSVLCVPLITDSGDLLAVLQFINKVSESGQGFADGDVNVASVLASLLVKCCETLAKVLTGLADNSALSAAVTDLQSLLDDLSARNDEIKFTQDLEALVADMLGALLLQTKADVCAIHGVGRLLSHADKPDSPADKDVVAGACAKLRDSASGKTITFVADLRDAAPYQAAAVHGLNHEADTRQGGAGRAVLVCMWQNSLNKLPKSSKDIISLFASQHGTFFRSSSYRLITRANICQPPTHASTQGMLGAETGQTKLSTGFQSSSHLTRPLAPPLTHPPQIERAVARWIELEETANATGPSSQGVRLSVSNVKTASLNAELEQMRTLRKLLEEFDGQAKEFQDLLRSGGNIGAFDFASAASKSGTKRTKSEDEQQAALSFTIRQMFEYGVRFFLFRGKIKMATFVYTACTMFGTNSVVARMPKATQGLMDATIGILLCKEKNRIRPGSCTKDTSLRPMQRAFNKLVRISMIDMAVKGQQQLVGPIFMAMCEVDLTADAADALLHQNAFFYDKQQVGELLNLVQLSKSLFSQIFITIVITMASEIYLMATTLVFAAQTNFILLLLLLSGLPVENFVTSAFMMPMTRRAVVLMSAMKEMQGALTDYFGFVKYFIVQNCSSFAYALAESSVVRAASGEWTISMFKFLSHGPKAVILTCLNDGTEYYGLVEVYRTRACPRPFTFGALAAVQSYAGMVTSSINKISQVLLQLPATAARSSWPLMVMERAASRRTAVCVGDELVDWGDLSFEEVLFAYPTAPDTMVLRGLTCVIRSGIPTGLAGPSGNGKSTIFSLILRLYEVNEGGILLGDALYTAYSLRSTLRHIGLIAQDPVLFALTVRENILYGNRVASEEEMRGVCERVAVDEFVSKMDQGYDSQISPDGGSLSGGQKQRVAIARALLRDPTVMLLDEATSALDARTEAVVVDALDAYFSSKAKTAIVIAHRLNTLLHTKYILFMDEGRVVEEGYVGEIDSRDGGIFAGQIAKHRGNMGTFKSVALTVGKFGK